MSASLCSLAFRSQSLIQCGIGPGQPEFGTDVDLTHQHTLLSAACDVPLSGPEGGDSVVDGVKGRGSVGRWSEGEG